MFESANFLARGTDAEEGVVGVTAGQLGVDGVFRRRRRHILNSVCALDCVGGSYIQY